MCISVWLNIHCFSMNTSISYGHWIDIFFYLVRYLSVLSSLKYSILYNCSLTVRFPEIAKARKKIAARQSAGWPTVLHFKNVLKWTPGFVLPKFRRFIFSLVSYEWFHCWLLLSAVFFYNWNIFLVILIMATKVARLGREFCLFFVINAVSERVRKILN